MPLNPAYAQQSTRKLPFCVGYVYVTGDKIEEIVGFDGATANVYLLADGEWDGPAFLSLIPDDPFVAAPLKSGSWPTVFNGGATGIAQNPYLVYHFHSGRYAARGLPNNLISIGHDNESDEWMQYFPSITPILCFSGIAYYICRLLPAIAAASGQSLTPVGIYRSLKCRQFDATGEVTGYGFTTNPTWQMIETILRFQLKCQQPGIAGLTVAERACFDWPAMVAHAQRNSIVIASGAPRFTGNFAFAADSKLGAMMETQLRNCRSFKRERGSQISFIGDDERASVFTFSRREVVPGTVNLDKKDLSTAPNVFVPQFRDLGIPAVGSVVSAVVGSGQTVWTMASTQPFFSGDVFTYSGGDNDATFAGDHQVKLYLQDNGTGKPETLLAPPDQFDFIASNVPAGGSAHGGYVGSQQSRFKQRAPTGVQHRSHQRMGGQVAPGIPALPRMTQVQYDFGNNTFDQTNRLCKFLRDTQLGPDVAGWRAPFKGTISGFLESVDASGNALLDVNPGDVITLDDTAAPDFPGDYQVLEPLALDAGKREIELTLQSYNPAAATDVSDPPGDSYQTLPNSLLPMGDTASDVQFFLMQATPSGALGADGKVVLTLADLSIWWTGDVAPTAYNISLGGIPLNQHVIIYLMIGSKLVAPTMTMATTQYPPVPVPGNQVVIFIGTLTNSSSANGQAIATPPVAFTQGAGSAGAGNQSASATPPQPLFYTPSTTGYLGPNTADDAGVS